MLALESKQQRQTLLAPNASVATFGGIPSPGQRVGDGASQTSGSSIPYIPEDILCHINSLMPIDVAARAACLSSVFLNSWRCYPKLDLGPTTLCPKRDDQNLSRKIDSILRNHSGIGLKILKLGVGSQKSCIPYIDSWLHFALKPGLQELDLWLLKEYNFPCSTLSADGVRNSLQSLRLHFCTFRPMPDLGPLRSLTRLTLCYVHITGEELECLLANSLALEHLNLRCCKEMILLKIPSMLLQLSYLEVSGCWGLHQVIENKAPNLSTFILDGKVSKFSLGEASQMMKAFSLARTDAISYACAELPSIMPNLESLGLSSITDQVHTTPPMLRTKFLNLKHLSIQICGGMSSQPYDHFTLACFLDASPCLETWRLDVHGDRGKHESVFGGPLHLWQLPEHLKLKSVEIIGFTSAKILVELTCCIAKSAVSLERLTLNTSDGFAWCSKENNIDCQDLCYPIKKVVLEEASSAVVAIKRYIEDKVPPTVKLTVVEPCPCLRCRSTNRG